MENVIDVDFHVIWPSPVFIRIGSGMRERIGGPDAALSALLHRWPTGNNSEYLAAKRHCMNAVSQHGSPALARSAFVEAAAAAKVLA